MKRAWYHESALDAWEAAVAALFALGALELLEPGFVSRFFNLNWLVIFAFAAAVFALSTHKSGDDATRRPFAGVVLALAAFAGAAGAWLLLGSLALKWRVLAAIFTAATAAAARRAFDDEKE